MKIGFIGVGVMGAPHGAQPDEKRLSDVTHLYPHQSPKAEGVIAAGATLVRYHCGLRRGTRMWSSRWWAIPRTWRKSISAKRAF